MACDQMDRNNPQGSRDFTASNAPSGPRRRDNVFEDIHADEDVFQFIGSVNGHTITAKSISAKSRTTQCFGNLSDLNLQHISNNRRATAIEDADQQSITATFEINHGKGQQLGK